MAAKPPADMDDTLWTRAQAAIAESRRLVGEQAEILDGIQDTTIHRLVVAKGAQSWVLEAERRIAEAGRLAIRTGDAAIAGAQPAEQHQQTVENIMRLREELPRPAVESAALGDRSKRECGQE
jgi:hypothetical protein